MMCAPTSAMEIQPWTVYALGYFFVHDVMQCTMGGCGGHVGACGGVVGGAGGSVGGSLQIRFSASFAFFRPDSISPARKSTSYNHLYGL